MKTLDLATADASFVALIRELGSEPVAVMQGKVPVAVLLPVEGADLETISLSLNPKFQAIIERSRESYWRDGGISSDEMRRRLGIEAPAPEKPKPNRRKRKAE